MSAIMENKNEVCKILCMSCLSVDRSLRSVTDENQKKYYLDTLKEIPLCNVPPSCPRVCWECAAMLRKVVSFREQVKDSYRILQTYAYENIHEYLLTDIARPPRLKLETQDCINILPSENIQYEQIDDETSDDEKPDDIPLIYVKDEVKIEKDEIDLEDATQPDSGAISESDNPDILKIEEEIETLICDIKKKKKKDDRGKKKKHSLRAEKKLSKQSKKQAQQKIVTIELSYEEMLLERQKKASKESYLKAEYKCEDCVLGFNYSKSYKAHLNAKHSNVHGDYSCPICKIVVSSVESFTAHYKRHTRRYECSICHKRTADIKVMQQHYFSVHEISLKQYKCNLCGKVSNSIDTHRYHMDTHKARVKCTECDKTFTHRAGLMNHRLAVHELQNSFPCTECDKVFRWKASLKRHLEIHDNKNDSSRVAAHCETCDISFTSQSSYRRHLNNSLKHVTQDQLKFICDDCGRRFADKTKLRDHIEEKHLHKTYHCHICLKPSKNRVGLDQHIRNVHKRRPNKICHHCGKGFPTRVQLESHIRTHTGERPFICELCPTTFSQQSNLYKHNRQVHLNIKSKRYPVCKKRKEDTEQVQDYNRSIVMQYNTQRFVM